MELTYHRKGDYLFPNLTVQDKPMSIGKYGMLRRTYLRENKKNWYQSMLMSGRLNQHLAQIDEQAENRMEELIESLNECIHCGACWGACPFGAIDAIEEED